MRVSQAALYLLLFTPTNAFLPSFHTRPSTFLPSSFLGQDDNELTSSSSNPPTQNLSPEERRENLSVMRQIFKYDLADLQRRRDYAGWVEAKKDLKQRQASDPWFDLNAQMKEAVQLDDQEEVERLKVLLGKVGGPPPGVKHAREYAVVSEIYDTGMSLYKAENIAKFEQMKKNTLKWKQMMAERKANEEKEEEEWRNNPYKEEEEAKLRREKSMKKIYAKIEERRKKAEDKAKDIQRKYSESGEMGESALDRALKAAKKAQDEAQQEDSSSISSTSDSGTKNLAKSKNLETSVGGRPRMPGDADVTRGEIEGDVLDNSDVTTDQLQVQVSSSYNAQQSDPPMRKHCFQYTIKITNLSSSDTIQLLSRRFEIQTVGARQKDIVQGQGVTGRQPILKPGETFEYTSTAPLSVRPIGTTEIAARMKGTYSYVDLEIDPSTNQPIPVTEEQQNNLKQAQLGTFHFIFPPEQRVKPITQEEQDEDDEEEEDDDVTNPISPQTSTSTPPTLPGDNDMLTGQISPPISTSSTTTTNSITVTATSSYRPERSDPKLSKHCFAYNIRITNTSPNTIQLLSRKFEIQTIGSPTKDVVQGPGVTGRQPMLKPGESFEYTSTAPLSVKPLSQTSVLARMRGWYGFVVVKGDGEEGKGEVEEAELGMFHFVLPQMA